MRDGPVWILPWHVWIRPYNTPMKIILGLIRPRDCCMAHRPSGAIGMRRVGCQPVLFSFSFAESDFSVLRAQMAYNWPTETLSKRALLTLMPQVEATQRTGLCRAPIVSFDRATGGVVGFFHLQVGKMWSGRCSRRVDRWRMGACLGVTHISSHRNSIACKLEYV